ncbi:hypothetical protein Mapa_018447 [Marchantia paleacea]|nr:hypothetical protein Mapa_018447 [Marchantia paleacea]
MANTTGRVPLWLIGTVAGILVIGLVGIFFLWFIFWIRIILIIQNKKYNFFEYKNIESLLFI